VSAIDAREDESGASRGFHFVCDGARNRVVAIMASAARQLFVAGTP
jgi:hypothetical protein